MAWTLLSRVTVLGPGSPGQFSYYPLDTYKVANQSGAVTIGYLKVYFQGDFITVQAAKNGAAQTLDVLALPCPPHTVPRSYEGEEKF